MARQKRIDLGEFVYHVVNRSNGRVQIFDDDADYKDFEYLLSEIKETYNIEIFAYAIMPNHWHFLLRPQYDGTMSKALHWLCTSHATRHHARKRTVGNGHIYQGRYKSFKIQQDRHFLTVLKYIERNPVRAGLCKQVADWRWGSAYRRMRGTAQERNLLSRPPVDLPKDYHEWINIAESSEKLKRPEKR